jgi:hypothetical protein
MLKRIPKSDISIRPFKAYKEWNFSGSAAMAEPRITLLEAELGQYDSTTTNIIVTGNLSGSSFNKHSVYGQLRAQFYNDLGDNPFLRTGNKTKSYTSAVLAKERFLSGSAKVISIPNVYVGEGIKKGSVILTDGDVSYYDDSYGNLYEDRDRLDLRILEVSGSFITFTDINEDNYTSDLIEFGIGDTDIDDNTMNMIYDGDLWNLTLISADIQSGIMLFVAVPFLPELSRKIRVGNIFYNQGLITLTRNVDNRLIGDWDIVYKSTQTIYEHEYLLIANEDEFNVSQNPSAIVEIGKETGFVTGTDGKIYKTITKAGVKYIRKKSTLENGDILDYRFTGTTGSAKAGFEHWEVSGSVDSTGSFLAPFITTIGLYDDNCDLVAVAKLPQPIKSEPDITVNFIVRFDT